MVPFETTHWTKIIKLLNQKKYLILKFVWKDLSQINYNASMKTRDVKLTSNR